MNNPDTPVRPATPAGKTSEKATPSRLPCRWPCLGLAGVATWLLLFSVGVLIDSTPNRERLGLDITRKSNAAAALKTEQRIWKLENPGKEPPATNAGAPDAIAHTTPKETASAAGIVSDFLVSMFAFMPLNLGFLCVLAAFIGGCSVNRDEIARVETAIAALKPDDDPSYAEGLRRRLGYLTEHPGNSAIRGLVVYLILISGLFVLGTSPMGEGDNQWLDLTQYMRLAGLFSFFGYIAGNDPTVFSSLLNLGSSRLRPQPDGPPSKR